MSTTLESTTWSRLSTSQVTTKLVKPSYSSMTTLLMADAQMPSGQNAFLMEYLTSTVLLYSISKIWLKSYQLTSRLYLRMTCQNSFSACSISELPFPSGLNSSSLLMSLNLLNSFTPLMKLRGSTFSFTTSPTSYPSFLISVASMASYFSSRLGMRPGSISPNPCSLLTSITSSTASVWPTLIGSNHLELTPCTTGCADAHLSSSFLLMRGRFMAPADSPELQYSLKSCRVVLRTNWAQETSGWILGTKVMSAEPATLFMNLRMNRQDSSELVCSTASTSRNSGVTIRIDLEIDREGIWSMAMFINVRHYYKYRSTCLDWLLLQGDAGCQHLLPQPLLQPPRFDLGQALLDAGDVGGRALGLIQHNNLHKVVIFFALLLVHLLGLVLVDLLLGFCLLP